MYLWPFGAAKGASITPSVGGSGFGQVPPEYLKLAAHGRGLVVACGCLWCASCAGAGPSSQKLAAMVPPVRDQLPEALLEITTPLLGDVWERELLGNPDRQLAGYGSFRVGFDHSKPLRSRPSNMKSALEHPEVVSAYLAQEKLLNRMAVVHPDCHISPFGVIPKKVKPGHWHLIVDMSSPENASVNDGIDKDMCSTSYITTDSVVVTGGERSPAGKGRHPAGVSDCSCAPRRQAPARRAMGR